MKFSAKWHSRNGKDESGREHANGASLALAFRQGAHIEPPAQMLRARKEEAPL